jgi:hypothetical protein
MSLTYEWSNVFVLSMEARGVVLARGEAAALARLLAWVKVGASQ